jgi:hypothetical protein
MSESIDTGILNREMISFHRYLATSQAFSVQVRKTSTHPEKVKTNTSKYLHLLTHGFLVKSTIRFSKEFLQHFVLGVAPLALLRIVFGTETAPFTYCLTYAGDLGDI